MSLSAILEAIYTTGEAQVKVIEDEAQIQINEILANAHAEAQEMETRARQAMLYPASQERARIMHRARLEMLHISGNVREELVDRALDQTRGRLASLRTDPNYPEILAHLADQALKELEASLEKVDRARLHADRRDKALLELILAKIDSQIPVVYNLECWGGVVAQSEDGRVVVINTLESRLERAAPFLRHYLAAWFEGISVARQTLEG